MGVAIRERKIPKTDVRESLESQPRRLLIGSTEPLEPEHHGRCLHPYLRGCEREAALTVERAVRGDLFVNVRENANTNKSAAGY